MSKEPLTSISMTIIRDGHTMKSTYPCAYLTSIISDMDENDKKWYWANTKYALYTEYGKPKETDEDIDSAINNINNLGIR